MLLSDEIFKGMPMTKFPGGGLNYGEGTLDCLRREIKEEFNYDIEIIKHFYTTDYFQEAFFFENMQLISIYYKIKIPSLINIPTKEKPFIADTEQPQQLRWMPLEAIDENHLTFPVDKKVAGMIKNNFGKK